MEKTIRSVLLFDVSSINDLKSIRGRILEDNRKFAVIWSLVTFLYAAFCLFMSFYEENYTRCRGAYITALVIASVAFIIAVTLTRKAPLTVYFAILLDDAGVLLSGILIARSLLQDGTPTIMIFASVLIVPILFITNTLLNILVSVVDIVAAVFLLKLSLSPDVYSWCLTTLVIFCSMGVIIGHFVNKARFERYVYAESAVQLAETNAKLAENNAKFAELQTKYAYYDQMTGLKNRRAYSEKVEELEKEKFVDCYIVMVDVNGLKRTNDELGHDAGDELIIGTAECLRKTFEGVDDIYRLGGDEYAVISKGAEKVLKNTLDQFVKNCSEWKGKYINGVSVSFGFASSEEFSDVSSIVKEADQRMYRYKSDYYKKAGIDRRKA